MSQRIWNGRTVLGLVALLCVIIALQTRIPWLAIGGTVGAGGVFVVSQ